MFVFYFCFTDISQFFSEIEQAVYKTWPLLIVSKMHLIECKLELDANNKAPIQWISENFMNIGLSFYHYLTKRLCPSHGYKYSQTRNQFFYKMTIDDFPNHGKHKRITVLSGFHDKSKGIWVACCRTFDLLRRSVCI